MTKGPLEKKTQKIQSKNPVTYHNKDVASKLTSEALIGQTLEPFGLPHLKVMDIMPTNLPAVESNQLSLDNLFLLEDGAVAIIDYESAYTPEIFVKYLNYAARVIKRYARQKRLKELKELKIIVIYTADVENACHIYDLKGVTVRIEPSYLVNLDTRAIYGRLKAKLLGGEPLSTQERMQLTILPLTVKGAQDKQEAVIAAVSLAKRISDQQERAEALAGILTFSDKFIDENYRQKVKGALEMTQVEQMIFDEAWEKAWEQAWEKARETVWGQAIKEGKKKGEKLGATKAELISIKNLMSTMNLTPEQAMNALKIPKASRKKYMAKLSKNRTA